MSKEIKPRGYWSNPENIDRVFDEQMEELGRTPTSHEFSGKYSGALDAIRQKRYHPEVRNWNQYLIHRGKEVNNDIGKWTPEEVDRVFDEQMEELGRTPTFEEFRDKNGGAINVIRQKRYHPDVRTWNGYLAHRGIDLNINRWTPEEVDRVFDEQREELGRTPTSHEFSGKYRGAINVIRQKRYHPDVRTWNGYLAHRGIDLNRNQWTPEEVDRVFDEMKEELGKSPTQGEFSGKYSGALGTIKQKGYHPDVSSWSQYLIYRGEKPYRKAKPNGLEILEDLLEGGE